TKAGDGTLGAPAKAGDDAHHRYGLAYLDLAGGRLACLEIEGDEALGAELERLRPAEVLLEEDAPLPPTLARHRGTRRLAPWHFDEDSARRQLAEQFGTRDLEGFGVDAAPAGVGAAGALLEYARDTQRGALPHLREFGLEAREDALVMDAATRRNLELTRSLSGEHAHTLAAVIDRTATAMGSRLLKRWIGRPARDHRLLAERLHCVDSLLTAGVADSLARRLREVGDAERILSRVALRSARPRDLAHLGRGLGTIPALIDALRPVDTPLVQASLEALTPPPLAAMHHLLSAALVESPPVTLRDGGVFADGYDAELDELRRLSENADGYLRELEARERERTGVATLKVGYNRVHGYYIELGRTHAERAPDEYRRRQTLKNAERYITPELKGFEDKVLSARERALGRERQLYESLLDALIVELEVLKGASSALATFDVMSNLAERAATLGYSAPELRPEPGVHIEGGRHPVVETVLDEPFVANDLQLTEDRRMLVITGPNMGGKSTYMRQCALIVLLAHVGSFVPADRAVIGPIDRIFTRIGAGDDLAGGRSTFMVEMTETANILNNATGESLVLLDEVGRGTSTYDGLSLAWAAADSLALERQCFTLFATHYFELTALASRLPGVANVHLDAVEHEHRIVFMHRVRDGAANRSYGLQVAALAGVPRRTLEAARDKLEELEARATDGGGDDTAASGQISLFRPAEVEAVPAPRPAPHASKLIAALAELDPNELTPREALDALYRLRALAEAGFE
ncbi:MAG: DNA mismatch repair protein MutS, partial [Gammaproteobacteria bacterium]